MSDRRSFSAERRLALTILLLVGLPSIALAVIGMLYVSDAQRFVERRHQEASRELALDLAARLEERLRAETQGMDIAWAADPARFGTGSPTLPALLTFQGDASGLRAPLASGPSEWERAYAEAYDQSDHRIDKPKLTVLMEARGAALGKGKPDPALDKALLEEAARVYEQAPWGAEAFLRIGLEIWGNDAAKAGVLAAAWEKALPRLPLDLAGDLLGRGFETPALRQALERRTAEVALCRQGVALAMGKGLSPAWGTASLPNGGIVLARKGEGDLWYGAVLPDAALEAMLTELGGERPAALGLSCGLAKGPSPDPELHQAVPGFEGVRLALRPVGGPGSATARLRDVRAAFYVWAVVILTVLIGAGSWMVVHGVRREARQVRLKADFVSAVSHELKTPLTSIRMFVDTLLMGRVDSPEESRECLGLIARETDRLSHLIEQVLTLARLEGGARTFVLDPVPPAEVLDDACDALQAESERTGIRIVRRYDPALADFPMDRGAMGEVVTNLLSNALKYSGSGREVVLEARPQDDGLRIDVVDAGPGIPPAEQMHLFERFYRGSAAVASGVPGTGLGLAIVRALVEGHAGRITVESVPGRGSRFSVWIPSKQEAVHA